MKHFLVNADSSPPHVVKESRIPPLYFEEIEKVGTRVLGFLSF